MGPNNTGGRPLGEAKPKRGFKQILISYFYWTYPRGCFHYDVMVTLILLFVFMTPQLWNYGDKRSRVPACCIQSS